PWLSIMYLRLLMISAVARSRPPAGMSGWCMCKAMANAPLQAPKSIRLSGRNTGLPSAADNVDWIKGSEPEMLGRPPMVSDRSFIDDILLSHAHGPKVSGRPEKGKPDGVRGVRQTLA